MFSSEEGNLSETEQKNTGHRHSWEESRRGTDTCYYVLPTPEKNVLILLDQLAVRNESKPLAQTSGCAVVLSSHIP
ncbi:hypothetical protein KDH_78020 [Dictyobacter sp. S3.2.2.5]|uniref:Uncharacterized protein n=1 Tax=Dictyobacter halimunensis TaxID=3026934 RepID=A0ABQ6G374_9CHLR|nr:hypothetical protein KDH_78020 [Dictyobacter sp. S3.2.2.5]